LSANINLVGKLSWLLNSWAVEHMSTPTHRIKVKFLAGLLAILCVASARGELPNWEDFEKILGKPISSQEVQQFVQNYHLNQVVATNDAGGFFNFKKAPFAVIYRANNVSEVEVAVWKLPLLGVPPYTAKLPHGLKAGDTLGTVTQRLGAPVRQRAHQDVIATYYPKLRLELSFGDKTRVLQSISLYSE